MICKLDRSRNKEVDLVELVNGEDVNGIENTIRRQSTVIANLLEHLHKKGVLDNESLGTVLGIGGIFSFNIIATKESWGDEWSEQK